MYVGRYRAFRIPSPKPSNKNTPIEIFQTVTYSLHYCENMFSCLNHTINKLPVFALVPLAVTLSSNNINQTPHIKHAPNIL